MSEPSLASDAEWSVLLAACALNDSQEKTARALSCQPESLRWSILLERAERHGVMPLLHQALSGVQEKIPSEEMQRVRERYQSNIHKSLFLTRELIRILDCFDSLAIEVLPYKGVTLAETMYGDMALRQSGDIDLLIRPPDVRRARHALGELGYRAQLQLAEKEESAYLISGYESTFDSALGRNLLELQWGPQPRFYAVDMSMDDLFRRSVTVSVGGRRMKTLCSKDLLLVLSLHAAKHVWARLVWLSDIAQLVKLPDLEWDWVFEQARTLGIGRILGMNLLLSNRLLGVELPAAFQTEKDSETGAIAEEICAQMLNGSLFDVESVSYFRLMMRLRERRADRIRFLSRLAFTPGPGEWKAVHLPAPFFPFYGIVRMARLAARLMRA
jgi:Uncharacterised nucleotidyltransferase